MDGAGWGSKESADVQRAMTIRPCSPPRHPSPHLQDAKVAPGACSRVVGADLGAERLHKWCHGTGPETSGLGVQKTSAYIRSKS